MRGIRKIDIPRVQFTTFHPRDFDDYLIEVLAEGESKRIPDVLEGYTERNKLINLKAPRSATGKIVDV